jgi:tetratricopeptide (TPR) repeat protein
LASVATVLHDEKASAKFLEAAIAAHGPGPAPAAWQRSLGEVLVAQGHLNGAIHAFRAALADKPDDAETWRWLGRVLRRVDDLPAAVAACRRAVELSPGDWPALGDLAIVLVDAGAFDEASALFDRALKRAGDVPALVVGRAKLHAQCGRRPEAIAALDTCLSHHPRNVSALATLALALRDEHRFDEAAAALRRAIELAPREAPFWCGLGRTLLEAGRAEEALDVATAFLQQKPGHAGALSVEVLARLALGDGAGAERLLDYERFVVRRKLPVPDGFADLASFNSALAAVAATHPTLHHAPLRHATAAGLHSGSLLIDPAEPILALQRALRVAIDDYCRALPDWSEHPFVSQAPKSWALDMWCVVMQRGGHQIPHIHPQAWLSGAYYPALPEAMRSGGGHDGWFSFGEADRDFPRRVESRIVHVQPEEVLLVLFPSYFFHRTIPFVAEGTRISVAFDLVPTN